MKNKTASLRLGKALKAVSQWCRQNRDLKVRDQHRMLGLKMRGHYQYYGITTNGKALKMYYHEVRRSWRKCFGCRSHRSGMDSERFFSGDSTVSSTYSQSGSLCS
ncbi:MAG: group II intron maturase-specific domain-containing protein [Candidatus Aminicenantales bacterium]